MSNINQLSSDAQVVFLLILSSKIIDIISTSDGYQEAKEALEVCWNWVENKDVSGDSIYEYLDNGDETGLLIQMQYEKDEQKVNVWNCVVDAIAFTNWKAYQNDGEKYLPAPIEAVDEDLINHFITSFNLVDSSDASIIERVENYLLTNFPSSNSSLIVKSEIMKAIFE
ncbi:Imm6 family immunity protein [Paenibacillus tarimensis]